MWTLIALVEGVVLVAGFWGGSRLARGRAEDRAERDYWQRRWMDTVDDGLRSGARVHARVEEPEEAQ